MKCPYRKSWCRCVGLLGVDMCSGCYWASLAPRKAEAPEGDIEWLEAEPSESVEQSTKTAEGASK